MQARRLSGDQGASKRDTFWRGGLAAGLILALALSATTGWAEPDSYISIRFADPRIPDIHVSGVDQPSHYGTYLSPEEERAQDQAAVVTPPPDPRYYGLNWESHDAFDYARLQTISGFLFDQPGGWYGGGGHAWDYDYPLLSRLGIWRRLSPTPPTALPQYNMMEYRADLAAWRRARERAARHGVTAAPERGR